MSQLDHDLNKKTTVMNELGLHARPAGMIANLAIKAQSDVWLCKNGEQVDASSIIDILSLGCQKGAAVTLKAENPEDMKILNEIINLFEKGFGEKI
jgi:phosphocarrier protein HPr